MGLTPEIAKALKSTRELIYTSKRDNSMYTDVVNSKSNENNDAVLDIAALADENSISIEDLAILIDDLESRVAALESKEE